MGWLVLWGTRKKRIRFGDCVNHGRALTGEKSLSLEYFPTHVLSGNWNGRIPGLRTVVRNFTECYAIEGHF